MQLEDWLVLACIVIAILNLSICAASRAWGVFTFAAFMYGSMALLMIYGAAHTPGT